MRLVSVDITNYRVIRHARLELPDRIIGIIGPNGSGKSSIVEAISWALYGHQVARSGKEEIKSAFAATSDSCAVELSFELNGESYRLVRRLVGKTERSEVELFRAGAAESVGIADTRGYIEALLGLDWRGFLTSFLARQQELNALTELPPAKRREHLAGMLGIERVDRAVETARKTARLEGERAMLLVGQVKDREQQTQRLTWLREQVALLAQSAGQTAGAETSAAQELAARIELLREQQAKAAACSRWESEQSALARSAGLLEESSRKLRAELERLTADQAKLPALEDQVGKLRKLRDRLAMLRELERTEALRAQAAEQVASAETELTKLAALINALNDQAADLEQKLSAVPADLDDQIERARIELASLRDRSVQLTTQRDQLQATVTKLTKQATSLTELDSQPICDRCLRPLNVHDLDQVRQHLTGERMTVESELASINSQLTQIASNRNDCERRLALLEQSLQEASALATERDRRDAEREKLVQQRAAVESRRELANRQLAQFAEGSFDLAELPRCQAELAEVELAEVQLQQLRGRLARRPEVEVELADLARKQADLKTESERIEAEIAGIGFAQSLLEAATGAWQTAQTAHESARAESIRAAHARELAEQELTLTQQQLERSATLNDEIEQCRAQQFRSETLARLLTDFKKQLIQRIRPRLAELTSQLLADMTDHRYTLVELDEEYRIRLNDMGQFFAIERFSGGETDLANLCLRLAISQALTESAGMERSFVMLDEVFGSQDDTRRELVVQGLMSLRRHFPQMILITHIEDLKQKVEMLVELEPTRYGWSEVRVNGALA